MNRFLRKGGVLAVMAWGAMLVARSGSADIYQWEYVDPSDPSQGRQPSQTVTSGGSGVDAEPGVRLSQRNLRMAYLIGADLTGAYLYNADLTDADLTGANLTGANFWNVTLHDATLAQAEIKGTRFNRTTSRGFTAAQLYSTASYQNQDLSRADFGENDLTGWDLSSQNLTGVNFYATTLAGVDFTNAVVSEAQFYDVTSLGYGAAQLYQTASYQNHDLSGVSLRRCDLSGWDFSGQDLTNGDLSGADLAGADLTDAQIAGAQLYDVVDTGFTAAQFYSTASYQAGQLQGIGLGDNDLTGWDLSGQDLTGADLSYSTLTGIDFTGASISGVDLYQGVENGLTQQQIYSTSSYQAKQLAGVDLGGNDLSGWDFAGFDLEGAGFQSAVLVGVDITGANIRGMSLTAGGLDGLTAAQLYSTASYQAHDLRGVRFHGSGISGWDFEEQNLLGSQLYSNMIGANFRHAYIVNAGSDSSATEGTQAADFTGADTRGSYYLFLSDEIVDGNLIRADGRVEGLDLTAESRWLVRDYDGHDTEHVLLPPIAIHVEQFFAAGPHSTIEFYLEADAWDSTISFEADIPVTLDGALRLGFTEEVDVATQIGRTFALFDWSSVAPTGVFGLVSDHTWDLTELYTTGQVTLLAVDAPLYGDFNNDGLVDAADYTLWRDNQGAAAGVLSNNPHPGPIGAAQYATWRANYGHSQAGLPATPAPEPGAFLLLFGLAPAIRLRWFGR